MFTDRRYHPQKYSYPPYKQTPFRRNNYQEPPRIISRRPYDKRIMNSKRCFICDKVRCWSTKHPREERDQFRKKHNYEHQQYLIDDDDAIPEHHLIEYPDENEETLENTLQDLTIDEDQFTPFIPDSDKNESFFASIGILPQETVMNITANLADRSFIHAITATTPEPTPESTISIYTSQTGANSKANSEGQEITPDITGANSEANSDRQEITPEITGANSERQEITPETRAPTENTDSPNSNLTKPDSFTYITSLRYPTSTFYGVVIDTGASQWSTAGYEQYLAYEKTHSKRIDTSRAGMARIHFGIGSASFIGSVTIKTPIGKIEFHVLETDTPFLLCIDDMDALGVYYNNVDNMLVTPEGTFPVIRRFGHPFMLWDESLE
jgi:hypothetical protein